MINSIERSPSREEFFNVMQNLHEMEEEFREMQEQGLLDLLEEDESF